MIDLNKQVLLLWGEIWELADKKIDTALRRVWLDGYKEGLADAEKIAKEVN